MVVVRSLGHLQVHVYHARQTFDAVMMYLHPNTIMFTTIRRNDDPASASSRKMLHLHGVSTNSKPDVAFFGVLDNPAIAHLNSRQLTSDHRISFGTLLLRMTAAAPIDSQPLSSKMETPRNAALHATGRLSEPPVKSTSRRLLRVTSSDRRACRRLSRTYK